MASLDTAELLAGGWQDGCLLLVLPGGADLPYCKHLNGRGNALIRGACSSNELLTSAAPAACFCVLYFIALPCMLPCAAAWKHRAWMGVALSSCALRFPLTLLSPFPLFPPACAAADYVEGGGAYLGLCAGAYYACARVEFEPGSR